MSVCELDSLLTNGHPVVSEFFIWAVKDSSISSVFVDPGAGEFLLKRLHEGKSESEEKKPVKRMKFSVTKEGDSRHLGRDNQGHFQLIRALVL